MRSCSSTIAINHGVLSQVSVFRSMVTYILLSLCLAAGVFGQDVSDKEAKDWLDQQKKAKADRIKDVQQELQDVRAELTRMQSVKLSDAKIIIAEERKKKVQEEQSKIKPAAEVPPAPKAPVIALPALAKVPEASAHDIKLGMTEAEVKTCIKNATDFAIYSLKDAIRKNSRDHAEIIKREAQIAYSISNLTKEEDADGKVVRYFVFTLQMETNALTLKSVGYSVLAQVVQLDKGLLDSLSPEVFVYYRGDKVVKLVYP